MEHAALTHNLGYLKQRKKEYAKAEELYRKAIAILGAEDTTNSNTQKLNKVVLDDFNSLMQATGRQNEKLDVILSAPTSNNLDIKSYLTEVF